MSVLNCNRRRCENIMCNRYSHTYGYICNECFEELVSLGPFVDIHSFMDSEQKYLISEQEVRAIYESIFLSS